MSSAERFMGIAVLQSNAQLNGPDERFTWLRMQAIKLKDEAIDLLVCPELFMTGYNIGDDILRFAEPVDGKFACDVKTLAREVDTAIVYGYPERDGTNIYNSAICIGTDGSTLANHRKSVLPPGFERKYFQTGTSLTLFSLNSVRVAILICYESEFPESVRNVSALGAEIVVVPTATRRQWGHIPYRMIPARALENGVYLAYANHAGHKNESQYHENASQYVGASCILDPTGLDLARAGPNEEVIFASLDLKAVKVAQSKMPYLADCKDIPKELGLS